MAFDAAALRGGSHVETLRWTERDVILHALAVGAGPGELDRVSEHAGLRPLPSLAAALLFDSAARLLGDADQTRVLHAETALALPAVWPVAGEATVTRRVVAVTARAAAAFVHVHATATDTATGRPLGTARWSMALREATASGEDRPPEAQEPAPAPVPDRGPDRELAAPTRPDQALLYRLCGDRNPLHADPAFAARGGFDAPILHGLCTLGIAARRLGGEHLSLACRFTAPVTPGEALRVQAWDEPGGTRFRVLGGDGRVAVDRGVAR